MNHTLVLPTTRDAIVANKGLASDSLSLKTFHVILVATIDLGVGGVDPNHGLIERW